MKYVKIDENNIITNVIISAVPINGYVSSEDVAGSPGVGRQYSVEHNMFHDVIREGFELNPETGELTVPEEYIRYQRNALLEEADILHRKAQDRKLLDNNDSELIKVATYRQTLRDLPQQEGFPTSVEWPEVPV